ncbi:Uncharacterized protein GBIM_10778 [Gryllus bimaculatus]|nr:Uncharacterized protein GBIM_10778 [Gryllus bimaculatus]
MSVLGDKKLENVVSCSWEVLNERSLQDALTLETCEVKRKRSLECMVSLETCVHLGSQSDSVPCQLEINVKKENLRITEISIVSEARIIEIYGKCGEYLATSHAEFLDECEDMVVYVADYKFPQPTPECSLKFARMKVKGQMWLYGIYINTEKDTVSPDSTVNFHNVNKILKDSSHQITDKADKCKKFLQMYSAYCVSGSSQTLPNPQSLLKVFDSLYLSQGSGVGSQAKNASKCFSDYIPAFASFSKSKNEGVFESSSVDTAEKTATSVEADDCVKFIVQELQKHIDRKFCELAASLSCQIDKKLGEIQERQDKKLDEIMHLLQTVKNA